MNIHRQCISAWFSCPSLWQDYISFPPLNVLFPPTTKPWLPTVLSMLKEKKTLTQIRLEMLQCETLITSVPHRRAAFWQIQLHFRAPDVTSWRYPEDVFFFFFPIMRCEVKVHTVTPPKVERTNKGGQEFKRLFFFCVKIWKMFVLGSRATLRTSEPQKKCHMRKF